MLAVPRGDRTGPRGLGPMTGRAAGYCAGYPVPGYMNPGFGGFGFGGGRGRGWRHMYWATGLPGWARAGYPRSVPPAYGAYGWQPPGSIDAKEETEFLKEQAKLLRRQLQDIEERMEELEEELDGDED